MRTLLVIFSCYVALSCGMLVSHDNNNGINVERTNYFKTQLYKMCKVNAGKRVLNSTVTAIGTWEKCVTSTVDYKKFIESVDAMQPVYKSAAELCRYHAGVKHCNNRLYNEMLPCLSSEGKEELQVAINNIQTSFSFFCEKNGERISNIINNGGLHCFKQSTQQIHDCHNTFEEATSFELNTCEKKDAVLQARKSFGHCLLNALKKCQNSVTADIMELYLSKLTAPNYRCESSTTNLAHNVVAFPILMTPLILAMLLL